MRNEYLNTEYPITPDYLTMFETLINDVKSALLHQCDLTLPQYRALSSLEQAGGSLKAKELSQYLDMTPAATTYLIDKLEKADLAKRQFSNRDRRIVLIEQTQQGGIAIRKAYDACDEIVANITSPLGKYLHDNTEKGFQISFNNFNRLSGTKGFLTERTYLNISLLYKSKVDELLESYQLPLSSVRIVFELSQHIEGLKMTDLANHLLFKLNRIILLSSELVEQEYLVAQKDPLDRRATVLSISSKGYGLLYEVMPLIDRVFMESANEASTNERFGHVKTASIVTKNLRKHFHY